MTEYEQIERAAAGLADVYTAPALAAATELLTDLYAAGARHGIREQDWHAVAGLASSCVCVVAGRYRDGRPRTGDAAVALLEQLTDALTGHGVATSLSGLLVPLPRVPASPRWGRHGDARLAVTISIDSGWCLLLDVDGPSPVIAVAAPHDAPGAAAVARCALAISDGEAPDPFRRR